MARKKESSWADEYQPPSDKQALYRAADFVGELHLFIEPQGSTKETQFGEARVAECSYVIILTGADAGRVFGETAVFGNLGLNLCEYEGSSFALGVVAQGKAKPGRSAPYILEDPTSDQQAEAFAWMNDHLKRTPDGIKVIGSDDAPF